MKNADKIPTYLFRAMTAEEVEAFWFKLRTEAEKAKFRASCCLTGDQQGIRFLCQRDYEYYQDTCSAFEQARHMFVEILAKG